MDKQGPLLSLTDLSCGYQKQPIVQDLNLHLNSGDIGCLLGPSGCGKPTTLRAIAGFEPIIKGSIRLTGKVISRPNFTLAPEKRRIGMVFQNYELFPNLSVLDNLIEAPLAQKIDSKENLRTKATELLESMGIAEKADSMPSKLSGGQSQRVAIARAMMLNPDILCFDEPTSALDATSAEGIGSLIKEIAGRGTGILVVTHDENFASKYATRIIESKEFRV